MQRANKNLRWTVWLVGLVGAVALMLSGCGGEDQCAGVDCDFGSCDSETGRCVNPDECLDDNDCIAGYACDDDFKTCEPLDECSLDQDCERGVCEEGACVNPETCEEDDDCYERTYCGSDGECVPDPCRDIDCERGVCERGSDECVSADSCTEETEMIDCVAGERCHDESCVTEEEFCGELDCERGVCDFEARECANASDCEGDDGLCKQGYYCGGEDRCREDLCATRSVKCDRGECDPASGQCENPTSCDTDEECDEDHICLEEDGESTCRLESSACGDADGDGGCPANQVCVIEENQAECAEPDRCETSFDCLDDRQCSGRVCLDPVSCQEDPFEPNDEQEEATAFFEVADDNSASGTLCEDDTDLFTFNSSDIVDGSTRGQLLVEADVPTRAQGLGGLEISLIDEDGGEETADTGAMGADASAVIEQTLEVPDHGEFTVEVEAADDVVEAGVSYDLSVNLIPEETVEVCDEATELEAGQRISANTDNADSNFLGSSCTVDPSTAGEQVYRVEFDSPQEVSFQLTAQDEAADYTMSLRERCTQLSTERGCVDDGGAGEGEELTALVSEGTYYLIVQSAPGASGGPYQIEMESIYTSCSRDDDHCEDDETLQKCSLSGGGFNAVTCDRGCNVTGGHCFPTEGDNCSNAFTIDPADLDEEELTFSEEFGFPQLNDTYQIGADSCLEETERTEGPDKVYEVEVPAGMWMDAEVEFGNDAVGSLYLVDDCSETSASCLEAAVDSTEDGNREMIEYSNVDEEDDDTLYLVIDTPGDQRIESANLEVTFGELTCFPDQMRCNDDRDAEQCAEDGRDFTTADICSIACGEDSEEQATCYEGVDCDDAAPLVHGQTIDGRSFNDATNNNLTTGTGFTGDCYFESNNTLDNNELIYSFDLEEGERLTVGYDASTFSGAMYFLSDCDDASTCIKNTPRLVYGLHSGENYDFEYLAEEDETIYLAVGRNFGSGFNHSLDIEIYEAACDPADDAPQCEDSDTLEYCGEFGRWKSHDCEDGCSSGECGTPSGEVCHDAISLGDGDTDQQNFDGNDSIDFDPGIYGDCEFDNDSDGGDNNTPDGGEYAYAIDLQSGDDLTVDYETGIDGDSTDTGVMYLLGDCELWNSCVATSAELAGDGDSLTYSADADGTYYLIVGRNNGNDANADYEIDVTIN